MSLQGKRKACDEPASFETSPASAGWLLLTSMKHMHRCLCVVCVCLCVCVCVSCVVCVFACCTCCMRDTSCIVLRPSPRTAKPQNFSPGWLKSWDGAADRQHKGLQDSRRLKGFTIIVPDIHAARRADHEGFTQPLSGEIMLSGFRWYWMTLES